MSTEPEFFEEEPGIKGPAASPEDPDGLFMPVTGESGPWHEDREERPLSAEAIPLAASEHLDSDVGSETGFVRPYAITGGRTRANHKLELETLVSTREEADTAAVPEQVEQRSIVAECRDPRSVAELASTLGVPLGVARVLISDAADAGLVAVHKTISGDEGAEEHLLLMERVLSGLRRL